MAEADEIGAAIARAEAALTRAARETDLRSPMAALLQRRAGDPEALVAFWQERSPGSRSSDARYRWELLHARTGGAAYLPETLTAWRPKEAPRLARDPEGMELALTLPIAIAEGIELLAGLDDPRARALLAEAEPVVRTDLAGFLRGTHVWSDLFALYCLCRSPRALQRMRPFAIALATCHTEEAERDGFVRGTRFPFHGRPLASASAMLAAGLYALAMEIPLVARLAAHAASATRDDGGFGDDDGPSDVLTTLLVTELLARVEPTFDPRPATAFVLRCQTRDGFFRALGPEAPWLTALAIDLLRAVQRPFAARFAWPRAPESDRDPKTRLPTFGFFVDLADLSVAMPGLAAAKNDVCFIDLIGFRAFNNAYGQRMGDEVLAAFARELGEVPEVVAIRDGGDEFLLVGAPTGETLGEGVEALRDRWPGVFRARFGEEAPPVSARYLTTRVHGAALREAREALGRAVGGLKDVSATDDRGLRLDLGELAVGPYAP